MTEFNNHLELYKLLPKTNCKECQLQTCLAFAMAVVNGKKRLTECTRLDRAVVAQYAHDPEKKTAIEKNREQALRDIREKISGITLADRALKLGAAWRGNKLVINCLGKEFAVDGSGKVLSECHTNPFLAVPLLQYVLGCQGREITGEWIAFRELNDGPSRAPLFGQRCEQRLRSLADAHPELFSDMVELFGGRRASNEVAADIAVVLHPFPKLPIMICYWRPEDGLESDLKIFFDTSADHNLDIESIFSVNIGLVMMFEKIMQRHA